MSIIKAIDRAYQVMVSRKWDTVYWAIDLHGVCLESNYKQGGYQWLNDEVLPALRAISSRDESKIILWSSVHEAEKESIKEFFWGYGINVVAFNNNPYEEETLVSSFKEKFYFSVLLDDKAGFDPSEDWHKIMVYLEGRDG